MVHRISVIMAAAGALAFAACTSAPSPRTPGPGADGTAIQDCELARAHERAASAIDRESELNPEIANNMQRLQMHQQAQRERRVAKEYQRDANSVLTYSHPAATPWCVVARPSFPGA